MIEIELDGHIDASIVIAAPVEDVESMLMEEIGSKLKDELMNHIDELSFIDMELNEEKNKFHYKAELVLCSTSNIVTGIKRQAQLMREYGLEEEQIENVLSILTEDNKGF